METCGYLYGIWIWNQAHRSVSTRKKEASVRDRVQSSSSSPAARMMLYWSVLPSTGQQEEHIYSFNVISL